MDIALSPCLCSASQRLPFSDSPPRVCALCPMPQCLQRTPSWLLPLFLHSDIGNRALPLALALAFAVHPRVSPSPTLPLVSALRSSLCLLSSNQQSTIINQKSSIPDRMLRQSFLVRFCSPSGTVRDDHLAIDNLRAMGE